MRGRFAVQGGEQRIAQIGKRRRQIVELNRVGRPGVGQNGEFAAGGPLVLLRQPLQVTVRGAHRRSDVVLLVAGLGGEGKAVMDHEAGVCIRMQRSEIGQDIFHAAQQSQGLASVRDKCGAGPGAVVPLGGLQGAGMRDAGAKQAGEGLAAVLGCRAAGTRGEFDGNDDEGLLPSKLL